MYQEVAHALDEVRDSAEYSIGCITGAGKFYSSGNDISNFEKVFDSTQENGINPMTEIILKQFVEAFINFDKPLIAAVNGPAIGVACTTLALCD